MSEHFPSLKKGDANPITAAMNDKAAFIAAAETQKEVDDVAKIIETLSEVQLENLAQRVQNRIRNAPVETEVVGDKVFLKEYVTDFSNIQEADIFRLDIPIQVIEHSTPEHLNVELRDSQLVPRWIHTSSMRLGAMKSNGFDYVVAEDLGKALSVEIKPDASGHFVFNDVVLMKAPKAKYYGQLRANFMRAQAMTGKNLHDKMRKAVESEIAHIDGKDYSRDFAKYNKEGQMTTYAPLVAGN